MHWPGALNGDADQRRHIPVYQNEETANVYRKMDFYLALNRVGRASLLQENATGEELLAVIGSQWNASMIYYCIRLNPTLFLRGFQPPSAALQAQEEATLLKRSTTLFPDATRCGNLTLLGPRQLQDALMCLPALGSLVPIQTLSVHFAEQQSLSGEDLLKLLQRFGTSLTTLSLDGVKMQELDETRVWRKAIQVSKPKSFVCQEMHLGWIGR